MSLKPSFVFAPVLLLLLSGSAPAQEKTYVRGDSNGDGECDISDAIYVLSYLFLGGPGPVCRISADANTSGDLDISDAVTVLSYLFGGLDPLPPLTAQENQACGEPYVVRRGRFDGTDVEEFHGVSGMVEQLSNRTIRLTDFFYDGEGGGEVYVWLHKGGDRRLGHPIGPDLRIGYPGFEGVTRVFTLPEDITDDMFHSVCIWCTVFYLNFGNARLSQP